jgi:DNA-binding NtrC family response regulator
VRIVLVDDDDSIRSGLSFVFGKKRVPLEAFATAEQALDYLGDHEADLVITDFSLPGLNGLELFKALNSLKPGMGKILITAYASLDMAVQAIKLGVHDFVQKPFKTHTVESAIESVMTRIQRESRCTLIDSCPVMSPVKLETDGQLIPRRNRHPHEEDL